MTDQLRGNLIAAIIRAGADLSSDDGPSTAQPVVVNETQFQQCLDDCLRQRVIPSLFRAVERGMVSVPSSRLPMLHDHLEASLALQVTIESAALRTGEILSEAGVDHRFVKGLTTSHMDYDNPALRHFSDVDVLVRPASLGLAVESLARESGASLKVIRGGRPAIQHAATVVIHRVEIDVHHRLLQQAAGHLANRLDLFADQVSYEVCGQRLLGLPAPLRLIQAASQNVLSGPADAKWSSDIDVLRLLGHAEEARQIAHPVGLRWLVDRGIARALTVIGESPQPSPYDLRWQDRLLRWTYRDQPSIARSTLCEAAVAPLTTSLLTLASVVRPGSAYLQARRRSPTDQLTRQLRRLTPFVNAEKPS